MVPERKLTSVFLVLVIVLIVDIVLRTAVPASAQNRARVIRISFSSPAGGDLTADGGQRITDNVKAVFCAGDPARNSQSCYAIVQ
jgi:hypothetical protein